MRPPKATPSWINLALLIEFGSVQLPPAVCRLAVWRLSLPPAPAPCFYLFFPFIFRKNQRTGS